MIHSGVNYFAELIGLDPDTYKVHFSFSGVSGFGVENQVSGLPQLSGVLSSTGGFYTTLGSGRFTTGISLTIANSSGMASNEWTHIFMLEKTGSGRGVLFDSYMTGVSSSGYLLGLNDGHKLYFESYDGAPLVKTSNITLGKANVVAVTKSDAEISFLCYDYNADDVLTESFPINSQYIQKSSKGIIGTTVGQPGYVNSGAFSGYLDEYLYFTEALTPYSFKFIVSGLFSTINQSNIISGFSFPEVTGFLSGITGVSGVTGYSNIVTGSGLNPWGTGDYIEFFVTSGISGYLTTGIFVTPLTGYLTGYVTGDLTTTINFDTGKCIKYSSLNELNYIRKIDYKDLSSARLFSEPGNKFNKVAGYDNVLGRHQLDSIYNSGTVNIFANGINYIYEGFAATGTIYNSGNVISGAFKFDNFYIDWVNNYFSGTDVVTYDAISGNREYVFATGVNSSGSLYPLTCTGGLVFFNGVLLESGFDFQASGGQFQWKTNYYSGNTTGLLSLSPLQYPFGYLTGVFVGETGFLRRNSLLWLNGQRQILDDGYIEGSTLDLVNSSGLFATNLPNIYNANTGYYETF